MASASLGQFLVNQGLLGSQNNQYGVPDYRVINGVLGDTRSGFFKPVTDESSLLGGSSPTDYWNQIAGQKGWNLAGGGTNYDAPSFDPNTGQVTYTQDRSDPGALVGAALAAGVGGLALSGAGWGGAAGGAFDTSGMGSATNLFTGGASGYGGAGAIAGGSGSGGSMSLYDDFLNSIGIDPSSTQFGGGTLSNADIASQIGGGDWQAVPPYSGSNSLFSPSNIFSGAKSLLGGASGLGALLGGAAGLLGGGQKPAGMVTSVQDIPDWLKPYVIGNLNAATNRANQMNGSTPLLDPAQAELGKTISGAYLNPSSNPYLQSTYDQAAKAVTDSYLSTTQPRTDALFYNSGAFGPGNTAYAETVARNQFGLGQNLQNLGTNIFGGNYNQERARQFGAAQAAPDFTTSYYQGAFSPFTSYKSLTSGLGSTSSQPYFTNPFGSAASGALGGYALGKAFGGP